MRNLLSPANAEDYAALLARRAGGRGPAFLSVVVPNGSWSGVVGLPDDLAPGPPRFPAYSVTKSLIATLVLQLVDAGRLALDTPLARFAPEVPAAEAIAIRHLLNHTSGLGDYGALPAYHAAIRARPADPWSWEEFAEPTLAKGPLTPPGARFAYSNPGYALLRRIVERETGGSLRAAVAERIAAPLGLASTAVVETLADQAELVPAFSRFGQAEGPLLDVRTHYHPGWVWHGVVASTSEELCAFYAGLFAGRLCSAGRLAEMRVQVPVEHPWRAPDPGYGLGLMGRRTRPVLGHNGGGPGYTASAFAALDLPMGIALASAMCAIEDPAVAEDLVFESLALAGSAP